jgi:hypothetical protein
LFDSGVLRTIFVPKRDEVTGDGRKQHIEELNDLCCSPFIRVIKSRRMTWARHVARMGERTGACRFWRENLREGDHLEDTGIDGGENIKMALQGVGCGAQTGLICLRIGTGSGLL